MLQITLTLTNATPFGDFRGCCCIPFKNYDTVFSQITPHGELCINSECLIGMGSYLCGELMVGEGVIISEVISGKFRITIHSKSTILPTKSIV